MTIGALKTLLDVVSDGNDETEIGFCVEGSLTEQKEIEGTYNGYYTFAFDEDTDAKFNELNWKDNKVILSLEF